MSKYIILVEFWLAPDRLSEFLPLVTRNAWLSLQDEPGCERFDVLVPADGSAKVVLYEIYADRAAFDAHCRTPHFAAFDGAVGPMVQTKVVTELALFSVPDA